MFIHLYLFVSRCCVAVGENGGRTMSSSHFSIALPHGRPIKYRLTLLVEHAVNSLFSNKSMRVIRKKNTKNKQTIKVELCGPNTRRTLPGGMRSLGARRSTAVLMPRAERKPPAGQESSIFRSIIRPVSPAVKATVVAYYGANVFEHGL